MTKVCLYCGLQFSDTTQFCLNCGRPIEKGFSIRPIQEPEFDRLRIGIKEKDDLKRQREFHPDYSGPFARKDCLYCGLQFPGTTQFCPNCGRPTEKGFSIRLIQESEYRLVTARKDGEARSGGPKAPSKVIGG